MIEAYYFGCRDEPGHYIQDERTTIYYPPMGCPWNLGHMDGGLLRNGQHPDVYDGKVFWTCGGTPILWYAFVWWDNSIDRRGSSNSGFYVKGFRRDEAPKAFEYACSKYPKVIARQRQPLVLQEK